MQAMTIRTKLILIFSLMIILIVVLSLLSITVSQRYLRDSVGRSSILVAERILLNMDRVLNSRIDGIEIYAASEMVRKKAAESNEAAEVPVVVDGELMKAVQDLLIDFYTKKYGYEVYSDIIITNLAGGAIAWSGEAAESGYSDEEWWKEAKDRGLYIGSIDFHDTNRKTGLPVAVRILDEGGAFIGVLKACITLEELAQKAIFTGKQTVSTEAKLLTEQGKLIYSTKAYNLLEDVSGKAYFAAVEGVNGYFLAEEGGKKVLFSYAQSSGGGENGRLPWILLLGNNVEEILAPSNSLRTNILAVSLILVAFCGAVTIVFTRQFTRPIAALTKGAGIVRGGDISYRSDIKSRDEIGVLSNTLNEMLDRLEEQTVSLNTKSEQLERRNWIQTGRTELNVFLRGENDIAALSRGIVTFLAEYCEAEVGALFLAADECLSLSGWYAYRKHASVPDKFAYGEGLVGQAAVDKRVNLMTDVPDDYVVVSSALGAAPPKSILILPLLFADRVKGVIELASLNGFTEIHKEFLTAAAEGIAIAIHMTQARVEVSNLLRETQAQAEELQAQQEELKTANEELEEQTQRLQASEEHLKTQQEELQVTNEELEEKNELLESQTRAVEQARKKIEEKAEELALSGKYKSEFLANMSHELRTPLNSLLLLSRSLADNKERNLSEEQIQSARIIHDGGNDLLNLINEILDLSKIEAGRMELQIGTVKTSVLAEGTEVAFENLAKEKRLGFEVKVSPEAPEEIVTDERRVEQVIKNLVSNAIKFTETGVVTVTFGCPGKVQAGTHALSISVTDTGIGMTAEQQKIVFEAFQQADGGTSRKYGGTGLGLSISRELAKLLGGEIHLESKRGEGSTFTLYLPAVVTEDNGQEAPVTGKTAAPAARSYDLDLQETAVQGGAKQHIEDDRESITESDTVILVIEDDPHFAGVLRDTCHKRGLKCLTALSGEAGLELAGKYLPNGVILDIKLPGIDGWTVLSALKDDTRTRHIPVHVVSADEASEEALRRGAVGYAAKPLTAEELEQTFKRLDDIQSQANRRVLVAEDNDEIRASVVRLISDADVEVDEASTGEQAIKALKAHAYGCMILDLGLPDIGGAELLKKLKAEGVDLPPVIVYTAQELSQGQELELREYTDSVVIKDVRSQERLLDEVTLFLHQMVNRMDEKKKQIIRNLHETDELLKGKTVLIVDDDMRTAFAVSHLLTERGMKTLKAENGEKALTLLGQDGGIDLVLMDVMMPVMDGYETIRRIRAQERFGKLPIIALTANAMKEDRQKCLEAGANDYMSKPVDFARLTSLLRVWLYR